MKTFELIDTDIADLLDILDFYTEYLDDFKTFAISPIAVTLKIKRVQKLKNLLKGEQL